MMVCKDLNAARVDADVDEQNVYKKNMFLSNSLSYKLL